MPLTVIHTSALAGHLEVRISRYAGVGMGLPVLVMFKMGHWALGMGHWAWGIGHWALGIGHGKDKFGGGSFLISLFQNLWGSTKIL